MEPPRWFINLRILFSGLRFLSLTGKDIRYFQYYYPVACTFVFVAGGAYVNCETVACADISALYNVVHEISIGIMGFLIASLAAVVGLPGHRLDEVPVGNPVYFWVNGERRKISRRRLIVYALGYCIFISFWLFVAATLSGAGEGQVNPGESFRFQIHQHLQNVEAVAVVFGLSSLAVTSLFVLFYLMTFGADGAN